MEFLTSQNVMMMIYLFTMDATNAKTFFRHVVLHLYNIIRLRDQKDVYNFIFIIDTLIMDMHTIDSESITGIVMNHMKSRVSIRKSFIDLNIIYV